MHPEAHKSTPATSLTSAPEADDQSIASAPLSAMPLLAPPSAKIFVEPGSAAAVAGGSQGSSLEGGASTRGDGIGSDGASSKNAGTWARLRLRTKVTGALDTVMNDLQTHGTDKILTVNQLENMDPDHLPDYVRNARVLLPNSSFRKSWDILMVTLLVLSSVTVPFRIAFFTEEDEVSGIFTAWSTIELSVDILFLVDVVLNFFTAIELDNVRCH